MMRSGNPALKANTFDIIDSDASATMTVGGTVNKTAILLLLCAGAGYYTWTHPELMRAYPGIVMQAVALTFGTLGALLVAYKSGLIKVTENFRLGLVAATGGIAIVYLIGFVMSFWGKSIPLIHQSGTVGILFSVFVVAVAALNLVMDFDFIERGAQRGAPHYMEWYGAFGLMVTLIWLYMEILRLLAKSRSRK